MNDLHPALQQAFPALISKRYYYRQQQQLISVESCSENKEKNLCVFLAAHEKNRQIVVG